MAKKIPPVETAGIQDIVVNKVANLEARFQFAMDSYIDGIQLRARELSAAGVTPEEIERVLNADIQNNTGEWKRLTGDIGLGIDKTIFQTANTTSTIIAGTVSDMFVWIWEPGAEHCDDCDDLNGKVKSYDDWVAYGLPGEGQTLCTYYCKCSLQPV